MSAIDDQYSNSEADSGSAFGTDSSDSESEDNDKSESDVLDYSDENDEMQKHLYSSLQSRRFQHTFQQHLVINREASQQQQSTNR